MRIAWVTPFNPRSAIARFSAAVCEGLANEGEDVSIVRSEHSPGDALLATTLPVYPGGTTRTQEILRRADAVVVNVGDNYEFHAGIFPCLATHLCVGVFHDFFLYNLFYGWFMHRHDPDVAGDHIIRTIYGEDVVPLARAARKGEAALEVIAQAMPMTEWIAAQCGAAIAHARFYLPRLEQVAGTVQVVGLSQTPRDVPPLAARSRAAEIVVLTVGLINPNKRADLVVRAIGSSPVLRERCRYRLAGAISDHQQGLLVKLAEQLHVRLDILGEVSEEVLQRELERADIISCLRIPVLEGASASAIEAMMAGRPVIVADAGFYAELPNDCVVKVLPSIDPVGLASTLELLVQHEQARRDLGDRARLWSKTNFSVDSYISHIIPFLHDFVGHKPQLGLARSLGHELVGFGLGPKDPAIKAIAEKLTGLWPRSSR
jgi:glycosyltransferase involved in cell wall biosynthesis